MSLQDEQSERNHWSEILQEWNLKAVAQESSFKQTSTSVHSQLPQHPAVGLRTDYINRLPTEVLQNIFQYLPSPALLECRLLSRRSRGAIDSLPAYKKVQQWHSRLVALARKELHNFYEMRVWEAGPAAILMDLVRGGLKQHDWEILMQLTKPRERIDIERHASDKWYNKLLFWMSISLLGRGKKIPCGRPSVDISTPFLYLLFDLLSY